MRPMNPTGAPRSYHGWSVWWPMNSLCFAKNISEEKWTDNSTDALISYPWFNTRLHISIANALEILQSCTKPSICLFVLVSELSVNTDWSILTNSLIDFMVSVYYRRTTQNWDGPPNHQSRVVRWATQDFAFSVALTQHISLFYVLILNNGKWEILEIWWWK